MAATGKFLVAYSLMVQKKAFNNRSITQTHTHAYIHTHTHTHAHIHTEGERIKRKRREGKRKDKCNEMLTVEETGRL